MVKNSFGLLAAILIFSVAAPEVRAAKLRIYFDVIDVGYANFKTKKGEPGILTSRHAKSHLGKFALFLGPIGVGTAIAEHRCFDEVESDAIRRADTVFAWSVTRPDFWSYFPVIVHYIPYSKQLRFGSLTVESYLRYSLWTSGYYLHPELIGEHYYEFITPSDLFICQYIVYKCPSSYFDIGICLSINPLRFAPFRIQLGVIRFNYGYHIPESFKKAKAPVPSPVETRFYVSYGLSIGYWGIR